MASLQWTDIAPISQEDAKQTILDDLDTEGLTTTSWQEGSTVLLQVELSADQKSQLADISVFFKSTFLPSAPLCTGDSLTHTSSGFYNIQRADAVTAQHLVTLACSAAQGPYTINVSDLVVSQQSAQILNTYRNVDGNAITYPYVLNPGTSITLLFEAETAGSQANIGPDLTNTGLATAFQMVTTLAGVTITSHTLYRSGVDEELDSRLLQRDQSQWSLLSRLQLIDEGVQGEILRIAPTILSVAVDSSNPRGQGTFNVYCAGLDATSSPDDVLLAQITMDRLTFGRNNTPKTCMVFAAPTVALDIAGVIYYSGTSQAIVTAAVNAALMAFIRTIPPGGIDYSPGPRGVVAKNDIETIIKNAVVSVASPLTTVTLTTPTADVGVLAFGKVVLGSVSGITYQQLQS